MKTLEQLKEFYDSDLRADIEALEEKRKKVLQKIYLVGSFLLCGIFVGAILQMKSPEVGIGVIVASVIITVAIGYFITIGSGRGYVHEFKVYIIAKIVNFIDGNLSYNPMKHIPKSTFMLSQIFKTKPNQYDGDDYVSGKIGQTKLEFCELDAEYESGSGKNRHTTTVFKGLFFIGDFNKHFASQTVVLPDKTEKFLGKLAQSLQSFNFARDKLVKMDDPEFEKYFVVYSDDQVDARYVLSTSLMKRIVDFKKKTGMDVHLSFVGSMVFVAISYNKNLFEPRIFRTLLDFEPIREYHEDLALAVGIVEDLNLNTRIWSKQ